jgi:hypothetical protein
MCRVHTTLYGEDQLAKLVYEVMQRCILTNNIKQIHRD